jgi:chondroitin-sulfate-ABC endolyase/exolyase
MIVCLGSNINNSGINSPVQTNLFQRYLNRKNEPGIIDGKKITAFPVTKKLTPGKAHWLMDTNNTGYYIPKGCKVEYSRKHQKSKDEHDKKATQGNFVTAWIDHGINPKNASYLYYVFPVSSKVEMLKFAKNPKPVKVLKKDANAHVISIPSKNIYGAVLFNAQNTNYLPLVEKVSRACLVMLTQKGKIFNLTVTDPDLDFKKIGKFKMVSQRPPLYVYLKGNWKLDKAGKNVKIKNTSNKTLLKIMCHDGLSNDIVLSPLK